MPRENANSRRYEEHAHVLDYTPRSKSVTVRGKEGIMVSAVGEDRLTLLEMLGVENSKFEVGERVYIGKEGRTKVVSVLGKMDYAQLSQAAQAELQSVVEGIVSASEQRFVEYLNGAMPLTPRIHALELIPGIGKIYLKTMLEEREAQKFASYEDLQDRVGFKEPVKHIAERILDEMAGGTRINLFVKR